MLWVKLIVKFIKEDSFVPLPTVKYNQIIISLK